MTTLPQSETVLIRREHLTTLLIANESLAAILDDDDERPIENVVLDAGENVDAETGVIYETRFGPSPSLDAAREAAEQALGLVEPTGSAPGNP